MIKNYEGSGKRLQQGDFGAAAKRIGIETAALLAFVEVEASGRGFDNDSRVKMLFEPHVFYRNLSGVQRDQAVTAGLAYRYWKSGQYPRDSYPRLSAATLIATEAAYKSASYGLGQILGENHASAGFRSAEEMLKNAMLGEREQLAQMVTLMRSWGIAGKLQGRDLTKGSSWVDAVRIYNGKSYAVHGYHTRCAAAYVKHKTAGDTMYATLKTLRYGIKGEAVRNLQTDLNALGYAFPSGIDGRFGSETLGNVRAFQAAKGLTTDGIAGTQTLTALANAIKALEVDRSSDYPSWAGQESTIFKAISQYFANMFGKG